MSIIEKKPQFISDRRLKNSINTTDPIKITNPNELEIDAQKLHHVYISPSPNLPSSSSPQFVNNIPTSNSTLSFNNTSSVSLSSNNLSVTKFRKSYNHLNALLWKNFILRRRRPGFLIAELFIPIIIPIILVAIRSRSQLEYQPTCHIKSISLPSMGLYKYLQSIVCNFLYSCQNQDPDYTLNNINLSSFTQSIQDIQNLLTNSTIEKLLTNSTQVTDIEFSEFLIQFPIQIIEHGKSFLQTLSTIKNNVEDFLSDLIFGPYLSDTDFINNLDIKSSSSTDYLKFGSIKMTHKQLEILNNLSNFICATNSPKQNDIGRIINVLKSLNLSNLVDVKEKLKRFKRSNSMLQSLSATISKPVDDALNELKNLLTVDCDKIIMLLHNEFLLDYSGRLRFFLFGRILYYPDTPFTQQIIYRASKLQRLLILIQQTLMQYKLHTKPILENIFLNILRLSPEFQRLLNVCTSLPQTNQKLVDLHLFCLNLYNFTNFGMNITHKELYYQWIKLFNQLNLIIDVVQQLLTCLPLENKFIGFKNELEFNSTLDLFSYRFYPIIMGIKFENVTDNLNNTNAVIVTMRQNPYLIDTTYQFKVMDRFWTPKSRNSVRGGDMKYFTSGFIDMQDLISNAIIDLYTSNPDRLDNSFVTTEVPDFDKQLLTGHEMKFIPTPCYVEDQFIDNFSKMLPQLLLLTWILTAMLTTKFIVEEKEHHLKEFTKIMGLSSLNHWLSWFLITFLIMFPCCLLICMILVYGNIIRLTNFYLILLLTFSYMLSIIMFSFLCSAFFKRANLSAIVAGMLYFIIYLPTPLILSNETLITNWMMFLSCFSNQVAFCLGFFSITRLESQGFGAQWIDLWIPRYTQSVFSVGKSILMLWIDSFIYLLITICVEYCTTHKFCGKKLINIMIKIFKLKIFEKQNNFINRMETDQFKYTKNLDCLYEPITSNTLNLLTIGVEVKNLTKFYSKKDKPVLDNLTINFYNNQITSFLGHNGAGKSTFISLLTGMNKPNKGTAYVCGHSVCNDLDKVRANLGFCPQYNILFDYLTVAEHIQFYALIRGMNKNQIPNEIDYYLNILNFKDKRNHLSKSLSGGQKRKLSIAIAFLNNSSVILLDEPTAGVDPYSRRAIWDLILNLKRDKTIILTTHHMDEADILGDRIAIISQGKLKYYGSSLYLKSIYGQGYYLILEKHLDPDLFSIEESNVSITTRTDNDTMTDNDHDNKTDRKSQSSITNSINDNQIHEYLKQFIPDIKLFTTNITEIIFHIPMHNIISDNLISKLFEHFEQFDHIEKQEEKNLNINKNVPHRLKQLGIISYGLTDTSLEEVFLTIADDPGFGEKIQHKNTISNNYINSNKHLTDYSIYSDTENEDVDDYDDTVLTENFNETDICDKIPIYQNNLIDNQKCKSIKIKDYKFKKQNEKYFTRRKIQLNSLRQSARLHQFTDNGLLAQPPTRLSLTNRKHICKFTMNHFLLKNEQFNNNLTLLHRKYEMIINIKQQFKAMFLKRLNYFKRSKLSWFIEFLLPIFVLILALLFSNIIPQNKKSELMPIHPWLMSNLPLEKITLNTFYENNYKTLQSLDLNFINSDIIEKNLLNVSLFYEQALETPYGWTGIKCLPKHIYHLKPEEFAYCLNQDTIDKNLNWVNPNAKNNFKYYKNNHTTFECSCKSGRQQCTSDNCYKHSSLIMEPSYKQLYSTDIFHNLTYYNITNYLLNTRNQFIQQRYGGLSFQIPSNPLLRKYLENLLNLNNSLINFLSYLTKDESFSSSNIENKQNTDSFKMIDTLSNDQFWANLATVIKLSLPPTHHLRIWFDNKGYVSGPAYLNLLHNLQLRMLKNNQIGLYDINKSSAIIIQNYPLQIRQSKNTKRSTTELLFDVTLSIFTILALSFIPSSFVTFLVKENQTGSKHLQLVSGLNPYVYWISNYIWDILNYLICSFLCLIVFIVFQKLAFVTTDVIGSFILLLIFYGIAIIPLLYLATFFLKSPSTSLVILAISNLLIGSITVMGTFLLDTLAQTNYDLISTSNSLKNFFLIFPQYCFGRGLYDLALRYYSIEYLKSISIGDFNFNNQNNNLNPFHWSVIGDKLCALPIEALLFFLLVLLSEKKFFYNSIKNYFHKKYPNLYKRRLNQSKIESQSKLTNHNDNNDYEEDPDVKEERHRVIQAYSSNQIPSLYSVATINVTKRFKHKKKPAVNSLTFSIRPGECFGLLGVNGAGKTTLFKMLTGLINPSLGNIYVNGYESQTQIKNIYQNLGFCPQFDALHDLLTGKETLNLYARLRGFSEGNIKQVVKQTLINMGLLPYENKVVKNYSGGNRRKLSTAIALLGSPQVVFLDEPTSGMDPLGKRFIWDQIINLIKNGRSVLLTTHSMEECEALCHRLGIMINGEFKCLGSVQHLKNRFGNGYIVEMKFNNSNMMKSEITSQLNDKFKIIKFTEIQTRLHEYQFDKNIKLSTLFNYLNNLLKTNMIEQYSVRQTTLDQVFVNFSHQQFEQDSDSTDLKLFDSEQNNSNYEKQ